MAKIIKFHFYKIKTYQEKGFAKKTYAGNRIHVFLPNPKKTYQETA